MPSGVVGSEAWPRNAWTKQVWLSRLPAEAKLVALAYAERAGSNHTVFLKLDALETWTSLSRPTCVKYTKTLVDHGWLIVFGKPKPRRPVVYALSYPKSVVNVVNQQDQAVVNGVAELVNDVDHGSKSHLLQEVNESSEENERLVNAINYQAPCRCRNGWLEHPDTGEYTAKCRLHHPAYKGKTR